MNKKILIVIGLVVIAAGVWLYQKKQGAYEPVASPSPSALVSVSPTPTPSPSPTVSRAPAATRTPSPSPTTDAIIKEVRIVSVVMRASAFEPVALTVHQGDVVQFANLDSTTHIVKSDDSVIYSGTIEPNGAWNLLTANIPKGTYEYHCTLHPSMRATLTIN